MTSRRPNFRLWRRSGLWLKHPEGLGRTVSISCRTEPVLLAVWYQAIRNLCFFVQLPYCPSPCISVDAEAIYRKRRKDYASKYLLGREGRRASGNRMQNSWWRKGESAACRCILFLAMQE
jgi:hypothetical protein